MPSILSFSASGMVLLSGITAALRGRYNPQRIFYILSTLAASAIMLSQGFVLRSHTPGQTLGEFQILLSVCIFFPAAVLPFFTFFARDNSAGEFRKMLPGIVVLAVLLGSAAILVPVQMIVREITFTDAMVLWRITFTGLGKGLGVILIVANVFFLHSIENTYRSSTVPAKVTLKYPVLGIFIASLLNLIVMSRILSVSFVDPGAFSLQACGLIVLATTFLYADLRYPLFDISTRLRPETASVLSVVIAGLFILAIALVSYVSALAGLSFDRSGLYVLSIFTLFILLAVAISGNTRRRLRRFLNENFYIGRYNYRKEWRHYARLMTSSTSVEDLASNTVSSLCETVMVRKGIIWIDMSGGIEATYGLAEPDRDPKSLRDLLSRYSGESPGLVSGRDLRKHAEGSPGSPGIFSWVEAVIFLGRDEECRGLIALGPKDMNNPYTAEDRDFLTTVVDQFMLTLDNLLMEQQVLESSRIESFNRFASFVIHDLKNTVGMLSLTAENARDNMEDRQFQLDAIETINRSVEKMRGLIHSLSAHKSPGSISRQRTDLRALLEGRLKALSETSSAKGIRIEKDLPKDIVADVDPEAMERVIENLLLNAIEATPSGGSVDLEMRKDGHGKIYIKVGDTGPGFDASYMEKRLFRPFSSTKKNGLGIGLVLCRTLVEAHGGTITIANTHGKGALVSVIIPTVTGDSRRKDPLQ